MMNAHLRDNFSTLKITRDDAGRLGSLVSATIANLSGLNLTGLSKVASANTLSAKNTFSAGRLVLPVGANKYEDLGGGLRRGIWVEGDAIHWIASNQTTEYAYTGYPYLPPSGATFGGPAGAIPGSVWVEVIMVHYIAADGQERAVYAREPVFPAGGQHLDTAALRGSAWIETYLHWIVDQPDGSELLAHADTGHADGISHSDVAHGDVHSDSHTDTGHADSHGDSVHSDGHGDGHADHTDVGHADSHADSHGDVHTDTHTDDAHIDAHADGHTDHTDSHSDHGDIVHYDQPAIVP